MAFKKYILLHLIILIVVFYSCAGLNKKLVFTPITAINTIETTPNGLRNKQFCYLVENYKENDQVLKEIDAFVKKNKGTDYRDFSTLLIVIYKKSSETNIDNINANKKIIDRYSNDHDLLYEYRWLNGKFINRNDYKDGELINPTGKVRVIDIP